MTSHQTNREDLAFGDLRALMNVQQWKSYHRAQFFSLVRAAHARDVAHYNQAWLPYIESFPQHFKAPLHTCRTLDQLGRYREMLPMACWGFRAPSQSLDFIDMMYFASSPHLVDVTHLCLGNNWISALGVGYIARSSMLGKLTHLDLGGCRIGRRGWNALLEFEQLRHVTHVSLGGNRIGPWSMHTLFTSTHVTSLEYLRLDANQLIDRDAHFLANTPHLKTLTHLDLSDNSGLTTLAVRALTTSPHLTALEKLAMRRCRQLTQSTCATLALPSHLRLVVDES